MNIKKMTRKDRHGGMFSIEFDTPEVPEMDHPGEPRGTDTYPAWLTPGENVVNAEASRKYQPVIDAMNEEGRMMQEAQGGPIPTYAAGGQRIKGRDYWMDGLTYRPMPRKKPQEDFFTMDRITNALGGGMQYLGGIPKSIYEYAQDTDWTPWNSGGAKVPAYYSEGYTPFRDNQGIGKRPEVNLKLNKRVAPTTWSVQDNVPVTAIHDGSREILIPPVSPPEVIEEPMPIRRPPMMPPLLPEGDVRIPTGEKDSSVYDLLEPSVVMDGRSDSGMALPVPLSAYANTDRANEIPRYLSHPSYEMKINDLMGYLINRGLSPEQAAGVVGNFAHETGSYVPNKTFSGNTIKDTIDFGTFQKGGPGRGAAQWGGASVTLPRAKHPKEGPTKIVNGIKFRWDPKANVDNKGAYVYDRFANLKEFAESQDREWRDPLVQLEFMMQEPEWAELMKSEKWKGADTPQLAAHVFQDIFERAGATAYGKRNVLADQVMEMYKADGGKIPSYYSSGGQVPQYYASGSGSWWDKFSQLFGNNQPSNQVVSAPSVVNNPASVPPLNQQTPPKPKVEDQGEYGVHDTIVRVDASGEPITYEWDAEKNAYVDSDEIPYTRGFGEWVKTGFFDESKADDGLVTDATPGDTNIGTYEGYPVYIGQDGKPYVVKPMGPFGTGRTTQLRLFPWQTNDIIKLPENERTVAPPRVDKNSMIPLPGVSKPVVTTPQDNDGVSGDQVAKTGEQGKSEDPAGWEAAYGWVENNFGHMFDKKLLARMATLYLGSRILGYEHLDSARYAAKDYLTELDAKADVKPSKITPGKYYMVPGMGPEPVPTTNVDGVPHYTVTSPTMAKQLGVTVGTRVPVAAISPHGAQEMSEEISDPVKAPARYQEKAVQAFKNAFYGMEEDQRVAAPITVGGEAFELLKRDLAKGGRDPQTQSRAMAAMDNALRKYAQHNAMFVRDPDKYEDDYGTDRNPLNSLEAFYRAERIAVDARRLNPKHVEGTSPYKLMELTNQMDAEDVVGGDYTEEMNNASEVWSRIVAKKKKDKNYNMRGFSIDENTQGYSPFTWWLYNLYENEPAAKALLQENLAAKDYLKTYKKK